LRSFERWEYLGRAPRIAWGLFARGRYDFTFDWMPMAVRGMSAAQRVNLVKAGLNLAHRRIHPWSMPVNMQVELTSYCNLRCPVCPVGTKDLTRAPQAIDVGLFESLMREVGPYLLTLALWAWGEPLLHPALERILSIARRYPTATLLSTNGQNLNQDRIQRALQNEPPAYLIVAIDGLTDRTNALYRKGARLEPALEGVRELAQWKARTGSPLPVLHCRFMAMRHNEHELADLREFATRAGFDMVSIRTLSIIDSTEDPHRALVPEAEALRAYKYENGSRRGRRDFVCQHAFTYPTVLADGTVAACEQDYNGTQTYGRFSQSASFASIWYGRKAAEVRKTIRDDPGRYSFCRNCPFADRPTSSCSIEGYQLRA
jgi:radical SAM protein with 4Fe4S-binding SPASM domain